MSLKRYVIVFMLAILTFATHSAMASKPLTFEVTIRDGVFSPSCIIVPTHQRIRIKIANKGKSPAEFENLSLIVEKTLGADVSSVAIIPPLRAGEYKFIDEFHPALKGFIIKAVENKK